MTRRTGAILLGLATTAMLAAGCSGGTHATQPEHSNAGTGSGTASSGPGGSAVAPEPTGGSPDTTPGAVTISVDGARQSTAAMAPLTCTASADGLPIIGQVSLTPGADGWVVGLTKGADPKLASLTLTSSAGRLTTPPFSGIHSEVSVQGKTYSIRTSAVDKDRVDAAAQSGEGSGDDVASWPKKAVSIDATCP